MTLVYLAQSRIPSRDANGIHVMRMCGALAALGHDVHLLVPNYRRATLVDDIYDYYGVSPAFAVRWLPEAPGRGRVHRYAYSAARLARTLKPDLVYARSLKACLLAARLGLPVALECHAIPQGVDGILFALLFRLLPSGRLLRVVAVSDALRRALEARFPAVASKVVVAHDAADPLPTRPSPFPLRPDRFNVGYVGHLYRGKGMTTIVTLARRCPWADFHVVGGSEAEIDLWRDRTAAVANLTLHGFVAPSRVAGFMSACDALLAPYDTVVAGVGGGDIAAWMSPLKLFEYMSSGKAIVCSDLPVLREVLEHRGTALLVPPEEPDGWVSALEELRDAPLLGARLGQAALRRFTDRHTWSARARRVLDGLPLRATPDP